ncbi:MAG: metallophosphoesterase [Planctomycetota bacterium]|nr:metallophosphoesterase [Planctomycetota bacterium]
MNDKAAAVAAVATATDVVVLGWILARGTGPIGAARLAQAAIAGAALVFAQALGGYFAVGNPFLLITIAWSYGAIALPTVAFVLLARGSLRARTSSLTRLAAAISLATVPLTLYATFVEPYRLVTEHADIVVARQRAPARPITVAVLADIQCVEVTAREREAVRRAMEAKPDLVLLPGDFVQVGSHRVPEIAPAFRELLAPLDAPLGVFCVQGDTDTRSDVEQLVRGTRVRFLDDQVVTLERDGLRVTLAGIGIRYESVSALAALHDVESRPGDDDVRIVMAHRPDVVYGLAHDSRVDLVVAGHTHGGQIALPYFGPPFISSNVPTAVGWGGLHDLGGRRIYVSRGIGWEHGSAPRLRFLSPPEVSILRLQ